MLTLRQRFFLLYLGLISISLVGIGLFTYKEVETILVFNRTKQSRDYVTRILSNAEQSGDIRANNLQVVADMLAATREPDFLFRVDGLSEPIVPSGWEAAYQPPAPVQTAVSSLLKQALQEGKENERLVSLAATPRLLVSVRPIVDSSGDIIGVLQTHVRLDEADAGLRKLKLILVISLAATFVVSAGLWRVVAGPLLQPWTKLIAVARAAGAGDYAQRLPLPNAGGDDVRQVAEAFNQMLNSVEMQVKREKEGRDRAREFLAHAAHELRSPVAVLKGFVDVLLRGAKEDAAVLQASLESMRTVLLKMTRTINDLLTLSRLEVADNGTGTRTNVDLNTLVGGICGEARNTIGGRQLVFEPCVETAVVEGETALLERAFRNLLENAIRYTPDCGRIGVAITRAGRQIQVAFSDNGEGIPAKHLPRIFDRFYRANPGGSEGSGLGLAIVQSVVQTHGGQVTVQSTVGLGSTFNVMLPAAG